MSAKWLRVSLISVVFLGSQGLFADSFVDDFNDGDLFDDGWEVCDGDPRAWRPCGGRACVDYGNPTAGIDNMLCRGDSSTPVASVEATMHFPSSDIQLGLTLNRGEVQEKGVYIDQRLGQTRVQLAQAGAPGTTFTCFFDPWTFPHTAVVRWEATDGMMRAHIDGRICETELISPAIGRVKLMRDADPSNVPGAWFDDVSLVARDSKCDSGNSQITFAGRVWDVSCRGGKPGNGCFSSSTDSVWVDEFGQLHLKARQLMDGTWCQAEVVAREPAYYGEHTFLLGSSLSTLDPRVVLGAFLFRAYDPTSQSCDGNMCTLDDFGNADPSDDTCVCEIDFEATGGFDGTQRCDPPPTNGIQVFNTIQPGTPETCEVFDWPFGDSQSTHTITWTPSGVTFVNNLGSCIGNSCPGFVGEFDYPFGIDESPNPPQKELLHAILNLWICTEDECLGNGTLTQEQEVVVSTYIYPLFSDGFESGDLSVWSGFIN